MTTIHYVGCDTAHPADFVYDARETCFLSADPRANAGRVLD
jgi:hypothetical protein